MTLEQAKYWHCRWTYELGKLHRYEPLYIQIRSSTKRNGWDVINTKTPASQEDIKIAAKYLAANPLPPIIDEEDEIVVYKKSTKEEDYYGLW